MPRPWFRNPASPVSPAASPLSLELLATDLRDVRAKICGVASAIPPSAWSSPSPLATWSYRDLLAHFAVNHWLLQILLANAAVDPTRQFGVEFDSPLVGAAGSVLHEEWRDRAIPELIRQVHEEGEETQRLVMRLGDMPAPDGAASSAALVAYLDQALRHDREHLTQLRTALGSPQHVT